MWTSAFWKATLERAVKTFAQTAAGSFLVGAGLLDVDWEACLSVSGAATVLSILTSVASAGTGGDGSPSLGSTERLPAEEP